MDQAGTPLSESQRLDWIDAARGFAILGIFMVNVPAFNAPFFLYGGEQDYWTNSIDHVTQNFIDVFFQASFYSLFSFLFGFGIQVIVDKWKARQRKCNQLIFRRLMILIGFGLIHAFLIWHGDILLSYGLIGLFLLLFFKRKNQTLASWAFGLLLIPTFLYSGLLYMVRDQLDWVNHEAIASSFENYGNGSIVDIWQQNYQDWIYSNGWISLILLITNILPLFLIGMVIARKRWLHDIKRYQGILKKLWVITFVIFIAVKAGPYLFGNPTWFTFFQDRVGGSASALFYVVTITLCFQSNRIKKGLYPLTYVGRMSLSNYIFQSIVNVILYYSVGFGLYGKLSPFWSVWVVLAIFIIQLFLSKWWLRHYRFGPLEWLWRRWTYQKSLVNSRKKRKAVEQG
ncbi:DUF418 domain-containing protein [Aquibacillus albus]|uniref:DUF418 domain-containing protein n=1 Tax=Aquibacillus albus TaxID=1168171 RepID=A0ABS2N057_9BACI|nr:DUF418 domain-containing protein [Aquibacillus albus]MBM7571499.1 uncharacterized protein [Aquibacillus albus]